MATPRALRSRSTAALVVAASLGVAGCSCRRTSTCAGQSTYTAEGRTEPKPGPFALDIRAEFERLKREMGGAPESPAPPK